jgi:TP901 family phage tail tape measure protein
LKLISGVTLDTTGVNSAGLISVQRGSPAILRREFARTEVAAERVSRSIKGIGTSLIALSAGAGLGLVASIGILKDFGQAMSTVQAVSGATEAQMAALTAEARRLGATTRYSATQAAEGIIFLSRAGFNANESLMAIEGTLKLAQSGNLDLARAADIASNVLGGFNLTAAETPRVVDVLAKAANSANVTVEGLGEALKYAAPAAAALGLTLEETVATIGKLGDSGIQGGLGGRGFNSIVTQFINKKDDIKAIIGDFDLASEGLTAVVRRLVEAGISAEQVVKIFRGENIDVFNVLASASVNAAKGTDKLTASLELAAGTVNTVSKIMGDNLNGAILTSVSALQELVLALGDAGATDALIAAFSGLTSLFRLASENADILSVAIVALSARALIPLAVSVLPLMATKLATLSASLFSVAYASGSATATLTALASRAAIAFGPLTAVIAAAAAAYVYLGRTAVDAGKSLSEVNETIGKYKKVQQEIATDTDKMTRLQRAMTEVMKEQGQAAGDVARLELDNLRKRIEKNKELAATYESLARAQLEQARVAVAQDRRQLGINLLNREDGGVSNFMRLNRIGLEGDALDRSIQKFREFVRTQQEAGNALDDTDRKTLELLASLSANTLELDAQAEAVKALGEEYKAAARETPESILGEGSGSSEKSKEQLATELQLLETLRQEQAIAVAKAKGDERELKRLERKVELQKLIADYVAAGLTTSAAEDQAKMDLELREKAAADFLARNRGDNRVASSAGNNGVNGGLSRDELDKQRQAFRETFSEAVTDAMASGNVGNAIKQVFADRIADGMKEALNDLADAIFNLFSDIFQKQGGSSSGGGGWLSSALGFGASVLGFFKGTSTGTGSGLIPTHGISNAAGLSGNNSTQIIIQGDASEKTVGLIDQKLRERDAALPSAIDARVNDRISRGAI